MYPEFQLYQSILSGSWQPNLPANRMPARFDSLLQVVRCVNGCGCSSFFRRLAALSSGSHPDNRNAFRQEALRLAGTCGCGGHNVFLSLPAAGARERFYNLLTGYCLQNYEEWISRVLHDNSKNETGKWYRYRMVGRLHALLVMHIPGSDVPTELLLIACRVKAAAAILMQQLMTAMPENDDSWQPRLWPREELKSALADCDLALPARKEVIGLFDKATKLCCPTPSGGQPAAAPPAPANGSGQLQLPVDHPLIQLQKAFTEESKSIRHQVKKLLDKKHLQHNLPDDEFNRRVDTATACRILGINRKTLQRLRNKNELPFVSFGGKYYYLLEDINALLQARRNKKKPGNGIGRSSC